MNHIFGMIANNRMLAIAMLRLGQVQPAAQSMRKSFAAAQAHGDAFGVRAGLFLMAGIAHLAGQYLSAARLLGAYKINFANDPRPEDDIERREYERITAEVQAFQGEPDYQIAWNEGYTWSLERAVQEVLALGEELGRDPDKP